MGGVEQSESAHLLFAFTGLLSLVETHPERRRQTQRVGAGAGGAARARRENVRSDRTGTPVACRCRLSASTFDRRVTREREPLASRGQVDSYGYRYDRCYLLQL